MKKIYHRILSVGFRASAFIGLLGLSVLNANAQEAFCETPTTPILLDTFNTTNTCGVFAGTAAGGNPIPVNERYTFGLMDTSMALANAGAGRTNVTATTGMFHHPQWLVTDIGNLFGTTIDLSTGDMFAAASSNYSSRFVSNIAVLQYGTIGGGDNATGAGAVYKMDRVTGAPSLFATLPQQGVDFEHDSCETWVFNNAPGPTESRFNVGVGLGNMTWDRVNDQLFVANWEDGRIYRLDMAGNILDAYDPDATDDGLPGFANGFVPYGLAVSNDGRQLFYGGNDRRIFSIDLVLVIITSKMRLKRCT